MLKWTVNYYNYNFRIDFIIFQQKLAKIVCLIVKTVQIQRKLDLNIS